jgi:cytochrome c oxidase subunit 2
MRASPFQAARLRHGYMMARANRIALAVCWAGVPLAALLACPADAEENGPPVISHSLSYMTGFGPKNYPVVSLLYGEIILSLAVVAIIAILVFAGTILRHRTPPSGNVSAVPISRSGSGLSFIYVGVAITFVILLGYAVWNYKVLAAVAAPRENAPVTVHVVGHQWWWEVRYEGRGDEPGFVTANEMHIPVGKPVRVVLNTADVIHSFWVPALTGKMDTIPGQNNTTWLQADKEGVYRGQCTEYCGQQHAHMGFMVTADAPGAFDNWWRDQNRGPDRIHPNIPADAADKGETVFMQHCAVCHTVRGTLAQGKIGPDLSHLMDRKTLAAATVPNTPGYLSGWISNPQHIKPGNLMPALRLSADELGSLRSFLQTLQ